MFKKIIFPALLLILAACNADKNSSEWPITVTVDLSKATPLRINPDDIVWLEANDSSMISFVKSFNVTDDRYLINSSDDIKSFAKDGRFLGLIARKGQGPNEYLSASNAWIDGNIYNLFDWQSKNVLKYDLDGNWLGVDSSYQKPYTLRHEAVESHETISEVYPLPSGEVLYMNVFFGMPPYVETFGYAENVNTEAKMIPGRLRINGSWVGDYVSIDKPNKRLLTWEFGKDTLFVVTPDTIRPMMVFDFGEYAIPSYISELVGPGAKYSKIYMMEHDGEDIDFVAFHLSFFSVGDYIYSLCSLHDDSYIMKTREKDGYTVLKKIELPDGEDIEVDKIMNLDGDNLLLYFSNENDPEVNKGICLIPLSSI